MCYLNCSPTLTALPLWTTSVMFFSWPTNLTILLCVFNDLLTAISSDQSSLLTHPDLQAPLILQVVISCRGISKMCLEFRRHHFCSLHCSTFYSLNRTWWKKSKPSQLRVMIWILPHYSMMYPRVLFFFILYTQSLYEITDYHSAVHHMFVDDLYKVCWSFWYQLSQLKVMIWILPPYSILVRIWHQPSQLRVMIWILPPYSMVYSRVLFFFVLYTQSLYEIIDYCSAPHHMFMDDLYKFCWSFWYQLSGHFYAILC